ncbi:hypothetical protein V500_09311 [Pseudogymnoascus sp. VKM F-4518 (FW-2643)]|nr:hypothetical protein V500_09311 [Pseudogymnoascus sp. VKM F-4518 (FW-2643)]
MSNEVAQPVEHESVRSSTVEQTNGYTSKASTASNHFGDSHRDQTSNEPDLTSVPVGDESSVTTNDTLKKNHTLLHVPSRSSSHKIQPSPTSTALSGATASDPTGSIGGGSRKSNSSIIGEKRNGSLTSSKRSTTSPAAAESTPAKVNATSSQSAQMQKPKKSRGFLSFLNCCGVPDSANGIDPEETALPVKPTTSTTSQARATTPSKPVSSAPGVITNQKSVQQQPEKATMVRDSPPSEGRSSVEGTGLKQPQVIAEHHANSKDSRNQPLPAIPRDAEESVADTNTLSASNPVVVVQAPTPIIPQQDNSIPVSSQNVANNGPAQVDTKVHTGDSTESGTTKDVEGDQQTNTANITLPPPPPIAGASTNSNALSQAQGPSIADTIEEKQQWLLPPIEPRFNGKKCLVLDLDETLVHSSFKILHQADFTIPVEIEGQYHNVYVIKRPGVDQFMKRVGELYEVVVFTASVSKYGDPLLDQLDIHNVVHHRLFRESCYNHQGNYVKDLSQVGRDLRETIIIDNSPTSYIFHPQHAVPISSWFSDAHDNELLDLIPVLEDLAGSQVRDVSLVLDVAL